MNFLSEVCVVVCGLQYGEQRKPLLICRRHRQVTVVFGTLGSIGDGSMTPLTMVVLGGMINEYGPSIPSNDTVNEVKKLMIHS